MRVFLGPGSSAGSNIKVIWFEKVRGHQACTAKKHKELYCDTSHDIFNTTL